MWAQLTDGDLVTVASLSRNNSPVRGSDKARTLSDTEAVHIGPRQSIMIVPPDQQSGNFCYNAVCLTSMCTFRDIEWQAIHLRFTLRRLFLSKYLAVKEKLFLTMSSFSKRMAQGMACLTDRALDS